MVYIILEGSETILDVKRNEREIWFGNKLEILLYIKPDDVEKISDSVCLTECGCVLQLMVEGQETTCMVLVCTLSSN